MRFNPHRSKGEDSSKSQKNQNHPSQRMRVKRSKFRGFRHRETESEESLEIAKGEFTKGPGSSIKEETWRAVKGLRKGPKDFDSRRTAPLISQRERFLISGTGVLKDRE
jgi:hypothetical protein